MDNLSDSFILMMFPRYAGGKFITNCLSLSRHALPQEATHAKYLIEHPNDYQYRLAAVMSTLPDASNSMDQWIGQYEFGDQQLYGPAFLKWLNGIPDYSNSLLPDLLASKQKLFVTTHDGHRAVKNVLTVWPNSGIIKLINHDKFRRISRDLKGSNVNYDMDQHTGDYYRSKYLELAGGSWPDWDEFERAGYDMRNLTGYPEDIVEEITQFYDWRGIDNPTWLFDVDGTFFDQSRFLAAMSTLYDQLGFDDFDQELVSTFWRSYIRLHTAETN